MTALSELIETGSQAEVSQGYAEEIRARRDGTLMSGPPWSDWNRAIIARWSEGALLKIKREAWRLVDEHER